ncbi:MAG: hypothetical protein AABZ44_01915 [Elusimicrobiota bacterium]
MKSRLLVFLLVLLAPGFLHSQNERVGTVTVVRKNVFDVADPAEDHVPYTWVNKLHIMTRASVIEREVLFKSGELFDPYLVAQTERNLRGYVFLKSAAVEVRRDIPGIVDVDVRTQDSWTTDILPSFGRVGGRSTWSMHMRERNILGLGKTVELIYSKNLERTDKSIRYIDPRLAGTRLLLDVIHENLSDGSIDRGTLGIPKYTLMTPFSMKLQGRRVIADERMYQAGDVAYRFHRHMESFLFQAGQPLHASSVHAFDMVLGYRALNAVYTSTHSVAGYAPPQDRRRRVVEIVLDYTEADYVKEDFISRFDRVEDFLMGTRLSLDLGRSVRRLGSTRDEYVMGAILGRGLRLGEDSFVIAQARAAAIRSVSGFEDVIHAFSANFYAKNVLIERNTFVIHGEAARSYRLSSGQQMLLGANSGLRGYRFNAFSGTKSLLFNVESRWFAVNDFLRVVSMAPIVFWDGGYVWPQERVFGISDLRQDVGVGLRFGFTRSATNPVVRFDLSYALNNEGTSDSHWLFSFGLKHAFGGETNAAGNVFLPYDE